MMSLPTLGPFDPAQVTGVLQGHDGRPVQPLSEVRGIDIGHHAVGRSMHDRGWLRNHPGGQTGTEEGGAGGELGAPGRGRCRGAEPKRQQFLELGRVLLDPPRRTGQRHGCAGEPSRAEVRRIGPRRQGPVGNAPSRVSTSSTGSPLRSASRCPRRARCGRARPPATSPSRRSWSVSSQNPPRQLSRSTSQSTIPLATMPCDFVHTNIPMWPPGGPSSVSSLRMLVSCACPSSQLFRVRSASLS